ncbi:hypothetical protein AMATHDRAFT_7745 [Amanita thiersii Skay4041]|uniref:Uncharacterized protein n=1 Tax=Amanita thiersii Skay4041 TaxID=703135 RepID=A0A2A9NFL0_9AGAR|nr:hypothetical protein AMATHDRAFT_7745 [Amanita thiersii Skay4041]
MAQQERAGANDFSTLGATYNGKYRNKYQPGDLGDWSLVFLKSSLARDSLP